MTLSHRGLWTGAIVLCVFLTGSRPADAQVRGAIVAGLSSATVALPEFPEDLFPIQGVDFSSGRRSGLIAGVLFDLPASRMVRFETGALFNEKGVTTRITVSDFGSFEGAFRFRYLEIPALAKIGVAKDAGGVGVSVLAGVTLGVTLDAHIKATAMGFSITQDVPDFPATDYGLTVAGRVEMRRLLGEVRYTHGLKDLKNRVVSFMAGWKFGR